MRIGDCAYANLAADTPDRFTATVTKSKRKGKFLIDYLRNGRGSTAVAPYSTRARPAAAISMPLEWAELSPAIGPAYFTVTNALPRLAAPDADPWEDFWNAAAPLADGKAETSSVTSDRKDRRILHLSTAR